MAGRSDVEALSRSFRSRILLLVLLLAVGLAAALWTSTREAGIGAPEDRRRIMVVTAGSDIDHHAVLERAGFAVEVDDYDDWLATARAAAPDSDAEGVALVLEHADRQGIALVVFEDPSALDFDAIELEPAIDSVDDFAERDYAAVSVGDYGFPHRLTVDDPGEPPRLRLPGYGALEAVFRQQLIGAREAPERPTVAELQFEDSIRLGWEMAEGPAGFEAAVAGARASIEATLDDGSGARTLVPGLATGTPIPTPDGGILLFHHELVIYSDDARTLEIEAAAQMQLSWIDPATVASGLASGQFELEPCTSLVGGSIAMTDLLRLQAAADGSAVAIGAPEGGAIVWRKTTAPGCAWAPVAKLDGLDAIVLAPRLPTTGLDPAASSRTVAGRAEQGEERSRVLVWALADDADDAEAAAVDVADDEPLAPVVVIEQSNRRFGSLAFLDDRSLAVASTAIAEAGQPTEDRLYLLDRARPGVYLSVPVEFFAAGRTLHDVFAVASASETRGPELLVTARAQGRVELIRVRVAIDAWRTFIEEPPGVAEIGVEGQMTSLVPEQLEAEVLFDSASVLGLDVRASAVLVSSADGPLPAELTWIDLASGERRRLTDNRIRDYLPRIAADGSHATFVGLLRTSVSATPFSVPRVLALPARG